MLPPCQARFCDLMCVHPFDRLNTLGGTSCSYFLRRLKYGDISWQVEGLTTSQW